MWQEFTEKKTPTQEHLSKESASAYNFSITSSMWFLPKSVHHLTGPVIYFLTKWFAFFFFFLLKGSNVIFFFNPWELVVRLNPGPSFFQTMSNSQLLTKRPGICFNNATCHNRKAPERATTSCWKQLRLTGRKPRAPDGGKVTLEAPAH